MLYKILILCKIGCFHGFSLEYSLCGFISAEVILAYLNDYGWMRGPHRDERKGFQKRYGCYKLGT